MAKHFLSNNVNELDFTLTGITTAHDPYTVVAIVDEYLKTQFYLSDIIPFNLKDNKLFNFSLYRFYDEVLGLEYCFVANTSNFEDPRSNNKPEPGLLAEIVVDERVRLVKELPNTDYFLIMKGEDMLHQQQAIMERLKQVPEFIQVQRLEVKSLPSRRNLIF
jgi:hypothetical protein